MEPDNRCCFCLTLRKGSIMVGMAFIIINLLLIDFYMAIRVSTKPSVYFDACLFFLFGLHIIFNGLLIAAAIKKSPTLTEPWLGLNVLVWLFVLALLVCVIFFGNGTTMKQTPTLVVLSFLAGLLMFCWIVVCQFRRNLIGERIMFVDHPPTAPILEHNTISCTRDILNELDKPVSPPPSYEEASKVRKSSKYRKVQSHKAAPDFMYNPNGSADELPPDYSAAVAMVPYRHVPNEE